MTYEIPADRCTTTYNIDQPPGTIQCFRKAGHDGRHAPTAEIAAKLEERPAR